MELGSSRRSATSTILCCLISTSTPAWSMPCCAKAALKSARAISWALSSDVEAAAQARVPFSSQLIHQLLDARKKGFLGARDVREAQLERTVQTVFLGLALNELEHALRIDLVRLLEQDIAAAGAGVDLANAEGGGAQLEVRRTKQGLRKRRDRAETIDHFDFQLVELLARWRAGNALVQHQAQMHVRHIVFGNERRQVQFNLRPRIHRPFKISLFSGLQRRDGALQEFHVQVVADFLNLAALFIAQ